ncbi:MAG: cation-translocating P-type ATPase [Clostridia bacterium]|nr:cation-translocating P-type ATPase [Clostridia bacterium]
MDLKRNKAQANSFTGLSEKEAEISLKKYGYNVFEQGKKISASKIMLSQFKDVLIIILLVSTVLSVAMGEFTEAAAIIAIVFLNALLGFIQEFRTERTLETLKNMAAPSARVFRSGRLRQIPAAEVVPKDIIFLEAGDRVPSDARLLESNDLQADESLLTGESLPVEKNAGCDGGSGCDKVFMGTMITRGRAKAFTVATGMQTEMGHIAGMLTGIEEEQTPLQKRLDQLGKYIAVGCLLICTAVSVTGILRGERVLNMVITGISLAVAAVPEGLPAIVTIALALGVSRMLKRNALIRRLTAVETLGCATVVCSDKTGTLTENRMTVKRAVTPSHTCDVTGSGFEPEGSFIIDGRRASTGFFPDVTRALEIAVLCNNAEVRPSVEGKGLFSRLGAKKNTLQPSGDPTEAALLIAAVKAGITAEGLARSYRRLDEIPFDSERKCMSVSVEERSGARLLLVKGAPDVILEKCGFVYKDGASVLLDGTTRACLLRINDEMADGALRVIAVAFRTIGPEKIDRAHERGLTFCGLFGMLDPPRKEACEAVRKCLRAGIRPVMITGDHKNTAAAVAKELGILREGGLVLTGRELDLMSEQEQMRLAPRVAVYARVSPGHKLRIVRCYKKLGNVVAMTGDGVNDAPAVKEADIGVSMGLTGTDVTKEASSIILLDDNFASMVAAIEEGRVIYRNIRKFIRYLISCNIGEVLTMFVGMLMGMPVILLPIQILWVNLVTDGLPAIALGLEPADKDVMEQKPRGASEGIFSGGLLSLILFRGFIIGLSTLGAFVSVFRATGSLDASRTAAFMTLVLVQLVHVFECKSETKNLLHIPIFNNIWLILAVLCSVAMLLTAVFVPALQPIFHTVTPHFGELACIAGYIAAGPVLSAIVFSSRKRIRRK